ncbi:MAG: SO_0444 family Cu/Zn efflux transporter [Gammaproteobacteria bacterium]
MLIELLHNIWAVLLDTAFWLLTGLLAAGVIKAWIPHDAMKRWVGGHGFAAVTRAALFGAPLPLCSCGVLPAAIGLRRAGASKEATVAFLISTPETSIDSVAVTYALMGPVMAIYRPLAALMSAMVTGMMVAFVDDPKTAAATAPDAVAAPACCASSPAPVNTSVGACCATEPEVETACCASDTTRDAASVTPSKTMAAVRYAGAELLDDISLWLAVGIVLAGIMLTFITPNAMAQWGTGLPAMLMMLVVGIPLYICAVASTPVAAGLLLAGVSPGAVLIFLLVGPATNIASFALVTKELGARVTAVYFAGIASVSLAMGLLLEWLLATQGWQIQAALGDAHTMLPHWLSIGSAVVLLVLAVKPLRRRLLPMLG